MEREDEFRRSSLPLATCQVRQRAFGTADGVEYGTAKWEKGQKIQNSGANSGAHVWVVSEMCVEWFSLSFHCLEK